MLNVLIHDYGGYAFSLELAEYLASRGNHVTYIHGGSTQIVQRFRNANEQNLSCAPDIEGIALEKPFAKYSFFRRWLQEREYGRSLARRITELRPDVIISANAPLDVQRMARQAARKINSSFVFWWQDVISIATQKLLTQKYKAFGWLVGGYYQALERALLRSSQRVISISDDFLEIAQTWGIPERNMTIIPNWAPLKEIPVLPKDNCWAHSHQLQDKFVFLYSGILGMKHDPRMFSTLAGHFRNNEEVVIVIISDGPGADWLRKQKDSEGLCNLLILPFQAYEDYPYALASADVLLSVLDAQAGNYSVPSKVLTYLCTGRSVLLSAPLDNLAARIVLEHSAGLVAPAEDTDLFCEYAEKLYQYPELRFAYGQNARKYAEETFDICGIGTRFFDCLVQGGNAYLGGAHLCP